MSLVRRPRPGVFIACRASLGGARRLLFILALTLATWAVHGCGAQGDFFPDGDVVAIEAALPRLACTIRNARLEEYGALLHSGYSDGFLDKEAKLAQMKRLFDTGFFSAYSFTDPVIWLDSDKARVMVDEAFRYGTVSRGQQDMQEWRKEDGVWRLFRQWQPDPSIQLQQDTY